MPVTSGHGNPTWTKDETILALELYQSCEGKLPGGNDNRVIALSLLLNRLPLHAVDKKRSSFRNPDGVAFKLLNLHAVATGKGLSTSATDRAVWVTYGHRPDLVKGISEIIRSGDTDLTASDDEGSDVEFAEGRIVTAVHKRRERSPKVRRSLLLARKKQGMLCCDACAAVSPSKDPLLQDAIFEAHHLKFLSIVGEGKTKLSDLALLCASCHRLLHRAIAFKGQWLDVNGLKDLLNTSFSPAIGSTKP